MGRRSAWPSVVACRLAICLMLGIGMVGWVAATESMGAPPTSAVAASSSALTSAGTLNHVAPTAEVAGATPLAPPSARTRTARSSTLLSRSLVWNAARVGALLALLGAWVLLQRTWLTRRSVGNGDGVVHVIGKVALDSRQQLHFVRVGRRLLVLLHGPQGVQHVTEIDDPEEVERVLAHWDPTTSGRVASGAAGESGKTRSETRLADDYRSFAEGVREGAFGLSLQGADGRPAHRDPAHRDGVSGRGTTPTSRSNSYFA